jgi:putative ABC transport system permease protein
MVWLQQLAQDVRFALRTLRKTPGFTATAIATLALGIGLTTTVFGVFNAVLLRPIGYPNPERLMSMSMHDPGSPFPTGAVSAPAFLAWKSQATTLEHVVAYDLSDQALAIDGESTRERIARVSDGFWELSGVRLAHGRLPASDERATLLVSFDFFETRLRGDVKSVGKAVVTDGKPATIVGVLPRRFALEFPWPGWPGFEPRDIAAFSTAAVEPPTGDMVQLLNVVGKLRAGVSIDQARAELETIGARLAAEPPAYPGQQSILRLVPLSDALTGDARLGLSVLLSAVVFVLLIACANVASLLFGRGSGRQREIAIRAAVGAGRGRLLRLLLIESLMLALIGGIAGVLVATWALDAILVLVPQAIPRLMESRIDAPVLIFALVASLVTAVGFGVGPALALGGVNLQQILNLGGQSFSSPAMSPRAGKILVAAEMALAVVLLTGAGLLLKSFWHLHAYPPGFQPQNVLTMQAVFSPQYDDESRRRLYIEEFLRRAASVPGVSAAGISTHGNARSIALPEGAPVPPDDEIMQRTSVLLNFVSEGSARALGLRMLSGRWISDARRSPEVVVNESLARRDFPSGDAVGRRIHLNSPDSALVTIVGVVADVRYAALDEPLEPEVYVLYASEMRGVFIPDGSQMPGAFTAVISTSLPPAALAATITTSVSDIDKTLPVFDVQTLEQSLSDSIAPQRMNVFLLGVFAATALGLALIGIYGVVSYAVTQRTHEIGVRMALGASRRDVVHMIVRQGVSMALVGIVVGVAGATALTRVMASLLYEVTPTDAQTFAIVPMGLALTALIASLVPALRAARIDPAETLR